MSASSSSSPCGNRERAPCSDAGSRGSESRSGDKGEYRRGLSRRQRLVDSAAFKEAFSCGRPVVGKYMVMRRRRGTGVALRLGVIVSKRTLRRASDRSRAKRLLREAYRLNRHRFKPDCDVVLIGRRPLADAGISDVEQELLRLAKRGGLWP